jgi:microcystin-dependent protein
MPVSPLVARHRHRLADATDFRTWRMPAGMIMAFAAAVTPAGFLLCNGAAVSRVEFKDLFNVIGTTWGAGDGSTTFNVPDLRSRVLVCEGQEAGLSDWSVNERYGTESHVLSAAEMPVHAHTGGGSVGGVTDAPGSHIHAPTGGGGYVVSYHPSSLYLTTVTYSDGAQDVTVTGHEYAGDHAHNWAGTYAFTTANAGSGAAHINVQPSVGVRYVVKT